MLEGIQGMNAGATPTRENYKMTEQDKTKFSEIVANYDPKNMSESDKAALRDDLKAAGLRPGEDMKNMMEQAGFQVGPPQPPSAGARGEAAQTPEFLSDFVSKFRSGSATENDLDELLSNLKARGLTYVGNFVDDQT